MNGETRLRFVFHNWNDHPKLTFESWVGTILALRSPLSTPRLGEFGCVHPFHSNFFVPMSHHKYNEWWDKVRIEIPQLEWSPMMTLSHGWGQFWHWVRHFPHQSTSISLTHQYYSELDRMDRNDLLLLVVKLQCQLSEINSIAAAERDTTKLVYNSSMVEERSIPATSSKWRWF